LLALGLVALAGATTYPRVRAAWELHDLASKAADYALCMAGPTGPQLIRDDPAEFRRLIRRRLVAAAPDEAPFAKCAKLSRVLVGTDAAESQHLATAARFAEYGLAEGTEPDLSISALNLELTPLAERARTAWPFVRGGYAKLVRASLGAPEAMHPVAPVRAGVGYGLPSDRALPRFGWRGTDGLWVALGQGENATFHRSTDEGASFRPARFPLEGARPGACGSTDGERGFRLAAREDGSLLVTSFAVNREPFSATAVLGEHTLLAMACDAEGVVIAARPEGKQAAELIWCAHERACVPMRAPARRPFSPLVDSTFDLARVASTTVIAVEERGIVRVVSTRDEGRTWLPTTVAFDAGDAVPPKTDVAVPSRLLAIGQRLFLYGAARRSNETYPLLVSDDQGASFRALEAAASAASPAPARLARGER
jgi:hypothetical protein